MTTRLVATVSPDVDGRFRWSVRLQHQNGEPDDEQTGTAVTEHAAWCAVDVRLVEMVGDLAVAAGRTETTR